MKYLVIILGALLLIAYTRKINFSNPPSVALWCVVMLLAWAAIGYGGWVIYVIR